MARSIQAIAQNLYTKSTAAFAVPVSRIDNMRNSAMLVPNAAYVQAEDDLWRMQEYPESGSATIPPISRQIGYSAEQIAQARAARAHARRTCMVTPQQLVGQRVWLMETIASRERRDITTFHLSAFEGGEERVRGYLHACVITKCTRTHIHFRFLTPAEMSGEPHA